MLAPIHFAPLVAIASLFHAAFGAAVARQFTALDGATPNLPHDPNTSSWCVWWLDLSSPVECSAVISENFITLEQFRRWNPSVPADCGMLPAGRSYCNEVSYDPGPSSSPSTTPTTLSATTSQSNTSGSQSITTAMPVTTPTLTSTTIISTTAATTTLPSNGVSTPVPTQTGMVDNCNKFHFVKKDQTCAVIAALYSISVTQFIQWNPAAKSDCSGLWSSTYACVGVIGGTPTPTTTQTGNGVTTPTPAHPGMVSNCNKFAYVNPGDTCDAIGFWNGIGSQWIKLWNGIEEECRSIQARTYVCVGLISGNGITTPTPAHPGMVNNCNKFAYVNPGDTCDGIGFWNGVGGQWIKLWNGIEEACRSIQAYTYGCIGVL